MRLLALPDCRSPASELIEPMKVIVMGNLVLMGRERERERERER